MGFGIERTYDGRALTEEKCIASGTLTSGELIALTAGAGLPTGTACGATAVPHGVVLQGGATTTTCTFARIMPGDVLVAPATAADGTTAMSSAEITSCIALVGTQAMKVSATALTFDGVSTSGGKLELVTFDPTSVKARVRVPIVS